ncbi:unnamed protein product [Eruca vesicaria subsp. sativa]|uniref:Uncharacterized protein n=1 Tax=Eruca vesicaria subsp. sativa TaxID=29727 RepID=A0ABC8JKT0_ERUVS|nr:unnamed protein product [Eruca vesicaria subsp. sativa]
MADNKDLKMKGYMIEEEGETVKEAYERGRFETMQRYRAMLLMYRDQSKAIEARHQEELNKMMKEFELVLVEAKLQDVQVPTIDWFKLGEPMMYD